MPPQAPAGLELPPHPEDDHLVLAATQIPSRKRTANSAYDDRIGFKRLRRYEEADDEASLFPWEQDPSLEQPPMPSDPSPEPEDEGMNPIKALGAFGKLSAEIREEILRYFLICDHEIGTLRGWQIPNVYKRPKLDLAIMFTCKVLHLQGLQILFGENTFVHDVHGDTAMRRLAREYYAQFGIRPIPIDTYGHLIRHVKISIPGESLRMRNAPYFHQAIDKFLPGEGLIEPANLHTLTIDLSAQTRLTRVAGEYVSVMSQFIDPAAESLCSLNVQYIRVVVTGKNEIHECVLDMCYSTWKRNGYVEETLSKGCESAKERFLEKLREEEDRVHHLEASIDELVFHGVEFANRERHDWQYLGDCYLEESDGTDSSETDSSDTDSSDTDDSDADDSDGSDDD
ncbi:hypothetical protein F5Y05DRAFT_412643 [Hypoxylon sp. FL0543]|nr:hypothetical protein F5Y05DRAFT_412643 [Hypoxylon sp. FL0543]